MLAGFVGRHHAAFASTNLCTNQPSHQTAFTPTTFTPNSFYSNSQPLLSFTFTPDTSYARQLLHQTTFTPETFYTSTFYTNACQAKAGGQQPEHAGTRWKPEHKRTPATRITDSVPKCCPCHANLTETATATRQCTRAETRCLSCPCHSVGAAPAKQINPEHAATCMPEDESPPATAPRPQSEQAATRRNTSPCHTNLPPRQEPEHVRTREPAGHTDNRVPKCCPCQASLAPRQQPQRAGTREPAGDTQTTAKQIYSPETATGTRCDTPELTDSRQEGLFILKGVCS